MRIYKFKMSKMSLEEFKNNFLTINYLDSGGFGRVFLVLDRFRDTV